MGLFGATDSFREVWDYWLHFSMFHQWCYIQILHTGNNIELGEEFT